MLRAGELALRDGNRTEAARIVQEARAYLLRGDKLTASFDELEKQAGKKD
jgi:hypothetical protein